MSARRRALTLLELLVVIAILAVIVGLLLGGIQKVREAGQFARGQNQLRQVGLAVQQYSTSNGGPLPRNMTDWDRPEVFLNDPPDVVRRARVEAHRTALADILPFIDERGLYDYYFLGQGDVSSAGWRAGRVVVMFQNPLDPSRTSAAGGPYFPCSYVTNAQVFSATRSIPGGVPDGLSNTIFLAEHYNVCGGTMFDLFSTYNVSRRTEFGDGVWVGSAPTFADGGYSPNHLAEPPDGDYYPVTAGSPPASAAAHGVTFQLRPRVEDCDPRQPNAASARGLQVAMGDGSVRTVRAGVAPHVFWAAVTPAGGEAVSPDW